MTTRRGQTTGHSSAVASLRTRTRNRTLPQPLLVANEFSMLLLLLLPLLLLHLLLLLAWFVQPAISNFTHTHTCSHMKREVEREWERERALWRRPSFVFAAHVPRVEPRTSGEHFRFHVARGKGCTKGVAITYTHTHAPTHTRVKGDTHLRGTWEHLVKSKSIHQSVSKNTTNIAALRTMSGEF